MMTDTLKKKHEYACSVGLNMGTVNEQRANAQVWNFNLHFHSSFSCLCLIPKPWSVSLEESVKKEIVRIL